MALLESIRKGKIKQPTQNGFNIKKWLEEYNKTLEEDKFEYKDINLFLAGVIIYELLSNVRDELGNLYKKENPFNSYEEILKIYFALSNRDRNLLNVHGLKEAFEKDKKVSNIFSLTLSNNPLNTELSLSEIAHGSVDGLSKAIYFCKMNIKKKMKIQKSVRLKSKIRFTKKESILSQLYQTYESYWNTLIWSNFEFKKLNNNIYEIRQPNNDYQKIQKINEQRIERLHMQKAAILNELMNETKIDSYFNDMFYLVVSKSFRKEKIKSAIHSIKFYNKSWSLEVDFLKDNFTHEMLNNKYNGIFNIIDVLKVFKQLVFLAYQYDNKYLNEDIDENDINKLISFCPMANKRRLTTGISNITGFSFNKVKEILGFLEYNAEKEDDLWAQPITSISNTDYIFLTSALLTPNIIRLVEHWLVKLKIELSPKGIHYEKHIIKKFNKNIKTNSLIKDYDQATSKRIKVNINEEEIDFLFRIGDKILLGEAKSIVTVDSAISEYRTFQTLSKASSQVIRKSKFLKDNLFEIFKTLNWSYDNNKNYEVVGFIINSGKAFVGYSISDIPIVDEGILFKYFKQNISPIISTFEEGKEKHIAWFNLYNNFEEIKNNIKKYLVNPPQIRLNSRKFRNAIIKQPIVSNQEYMLQVSRLISENYSTEEILNHKYDFLIEKCKDFDKKLKLADVIL